jgi:hypothetical protein
MLINVPVTAPTTRIDGSALSATDLNRIEMLVSTDNGQNYVSAGHIAPNQPVFQFEATDVGTYQFKAEAVDNQNPALVSLDSNVVSFTIAPPVLARPSAPVLGTPTAA